MKKTFVLLIGIGVVIAILGVAGYAYAQGDQPITPEQPNAPGNHSGFKSFSKGHSIRGGGFFPGAHGLQGQDGPLHEYLLPAFANAFGLNEEETQVLQQAQQIMAQVSENYPPGSEEFNVRMKEAVQSAVDTALNDGAITEDQAQKILDHFNQFESGPLGTKGRGHRGMGMPEAHNDYLSEYIQPALAEVFGLTPEELQARYDAGDTLWEIGVDQGLTLEEFQIKMHDAHADAINAALDDETITQEQADFMLERLSTSSNFGFGNKGHHP